MRTYHIHINGIVQGVGLRPLVYQVAEEMGLTGTVRNGGDGVHILFNAADAAGAESFFDRVQRRAPGRAVIISAVLEQVPALSFDDFSIVVENEDPAGKRVLMTPDIAICPACRRELHDSTNRRYRYPFITCTQCGPRYSIIDRLPYERENTAMADFSMCGSCDGEYHTVTDRRFFSQTNSCPECGMTLTLRDCSGVMSTDAEMVTGGIVDGLRQGKIFAIKGIGGYLLVCDAGNAAVIRMLRERKRRPAKPFALLYPDRAAVLDHFDVGEREMSLLESAAAPIVLLRPKERPDAQVAGDIRDRLAVGDRRDRRATADMWDRLAVGDIAPGLRRLGVMLPCSPLLELIAKDFGGPLVATSANVSGSPILYTDERAMENLFDLADCLVSYNRAINIPVDDSVVQVAHHSKQDILLRRSRGYAPSFLSYRTPGTSCVLSMGAFMKSSFSLSVNGNVFVSQFLGSGESYEAQEMYKDTLEHWLKLYAVKPAVVLADMHQGYFSHQYAIELAGRYGAELRLVQHHEAHFAAVLAENGLAGSGGLAGEAGPVLGVVWDGTGLGRDGNIWGGEFFRYEEKEMRRWGHFDYFPAIAGDRLAMEPRIAALCVMSGEERETAGGPGERNGEAVDAGRQGGGIPGVEILRKKFTAAEWNNYRALIRTTGLRSSSVGRLFDAVASLLGVCDRQSYEGEAALLLQTLAEEYVAQCGFKMGDTYFPSGMSMAGLMRGVVADMEKGKTAGYVAAKLHYSLVRLIGSAAEDMGVKRICFSGGVFQNALLVDWIGREYGGVYALHFHRDLSPNDENISFGQLAYYDNGMMTASGGDDRHDHAHTDAPGERHYEQEKIVQPCV